MTLCEVVQSYYTILLDETSIREKDDSADRGGGVEPHTTTPALGTARAGVVFENVTVGGNGVVLAGSGPSTDHEYEQMLPTIR
jgi:hypothetical protein